ncbi:MAG: phenylalanine--tRNA ligase subunit alpha, partial [Cellulomonas sp.]|nr:phenylalanine--tRNA ligase subunit alpha [Cellulomonas sp.]
MSDSHTSPEHTDAPLSPLDEVGVAAALTAALAAIAAGSDLDGLKTARLAHTRGPRGLSLANR